jgi:hypothetical protein
MSTLRVRPRPQRLIVNRAGLFFKDGAWTPYAQEATTFSTLQEALQVRNRFDLQAITLFSWPAKHNGVNALN